VRQSAVGTGEDGRAAAELREVLADHGPAHACAYCLCIDRLLERELGDMENALSEPWWDDLRAAAIIMQRTASDIRSSLPSSLGGY
jgi:hypothetical protein